MKPQSLFKQKQTLYTAIYKKYILSLNSPLYSFHNILVKKTASDI